MDTRLERFKRRPVAMNTVFPEEEVRHGLRLRHGMIATGMEPTINGLVIAHVGCLLVSPGWESRVHVPPYRTLLAYKWYAL